VGACAPPNVGNGWGGLNASVQPVGAYQPPVGVEGKWGQSRRLGGVTGGQVSRPALPGAARRGITLEEQNSGMADRVFSGKEDCGSGKQVVLAACVRRRVRSGARGGFWVGSPQEGMG